MAVAGAFVGVLKARLDESLLRLTRLADTDALTGLPNRRAWSVRAQTEIARAHRTGEPLAVALIDLDRFKAFNDANGHAAGDALLSACATAWRGGLREVDFLVRLGGDEFAALLPACTAAEADTLEARLHASVPAGSSCSIGLAQWQPGESIEQTLARGDSALYAAKRGDPPLSPTRTPARRA